MSIRSNFFLTFFLVKQNLIQIWILLFKFQLSLLSIPPNFLTHLLKQSLFLYRLCQIHTRNFLFVLLRIANSKFRNIRNSILESFNFHLSSIIIDLVKTLLTLKNIFRFRSFIRNANLLYLSFKNLFKFSKLKFKDLKVDVN